MTAWKTIYLTEAREDLRRLDGSTRLMVRKAIQKVLQNPLPQSEGGYGVPLGNKQGSHLAGCLKIKLLRIGIRVVYRLRYTEHGMEIVVIGARADSEVYQVAEDRLHRQVIEKRNSNRTDKKE